MKKFLFPMAILLIFSSACTPTQVKKDHILIFSETQGYRHESITIGKEVLSKMCRENGFKVDTSENSSIFTPSNLEKYAAIIFLSTTGDILNEGEQKAFEGYIKNGGGFVGIHAASDTEYEWPWYGKMVGAYFLSHPKQQDAVVKVINKDHPSTSFLPNEWNRWDEWYNFKNLNPDVTVLALLDETSYEGGKNGDYHPVAWYHEFDGGKVFYTAMGHTVDSYSEENFMKHVWGGIQYVTSD